METVYKKDSYVMENRKKIVRGKENDKMELLNLVIQNKCRPKIRKFIKRYIFFIHIYFTACKMNIENIENPS